MIKALSVVFLVALAGCTVIPPGQYALSPCSVSPAGYDCQVLQYMRAP